MDDTVDVAFESDVPARLNGARLQFERLLRDAEQWFDENWALAPARISPSDSGVVEVVAPTVEVPLEWSHIFGYAIHDLRSGLDHLAQQLCRLEGKEPKRPQSVGFPVAKTGDAWRQAKKDLASMPAQLLERIEGLQPCKASGELVEGLVLLHELSVNDKHYALTALRGFPTGFSLDALEAWPDSKGDDVDWDQVNLRLHVRPPAKDQDRGLKGQIRVSQAPVLVLPARMALVVQVVPWLYAVTEAIIEMVTVGKRSVQLPPAPDWAPLGST